MTPVALVQLYALRAHLDAMIVAAEAEAGTSAPREAGSCPQCGASADTLLDTSTLDGTKRSRCAHCGHEWER